MGRFIVITLGAALTVTLVVFGLLGWHRADTIVRWLGWESRHMALAAVRCTAVGLVAMGQGVLWVLVVDRIYRRDVPGDLLKLSALLVCAICAVSAVALSVAGR
jgi:hypothetical protein